MKLLRFITFGLLIPIKLIAGAEEINCSNTNQLFAAARENQQSIIEHYLSRGCNVAVQDNRGFTLYDIAALSGNKNLMDWLVSNKIAQANQYSPTLIKLIQIGMRFIDIDAGIIDSKLTVETQRAIREYQRKIRQPETGKISVSWLSSFYRDLVRGVQTQLRANGYNIGRPDGVVGQSTRAAMRAFRRDKKLVYPDYESIDDQIIYQLMVVDDDQLRAKVAQRDALAKKRAQQQAEQNRQRALAKKKAEAQKKAAVIAAKSRVETQKKTTVPILKKKVETPQKSVVMTVRNEVPAQKKTTTPILQNKGEPQNKQLFNQKIHVYTEQTKTTSKPDKRVHVRFNTNSALTRRQSQTSDVVLTGNQPSGTTTKQDVSHVVGKNFHKITGRLSLSSAGCSIGGRKINGSWCTDNSANLNHECVAIVSDSGNVFSLLCQ